MSRKLKKGYFVKGQFVAAGSELDEELKRELKGADGASRTERKAESAELQKLGESMLALRAEVLASLELPEGLLLAFAQARRMTDHGARRRQMQYIGKLMRSLSEPTLEAARAALAAQKAPSALDTQLLHQAEQWRQRLIDSDDALGQWMHAHPETDAQQLRALVRQVRKEAQVEKPGQTEKPGQGERHGRAYRVLYQQIRARLGGEPHTEAGVMQ